MYILKFIHCINFEICNCNRKYSNIFKSKECYCLCSSCYSNKCMTTHDPKNKKYGCCIRQAYRNEDYWEYREDNCNGHW